MTDEDGQHISQQHWMLNGGEVLSATDDEAAAFAEWSYIIKMISDD